MATADLYWMILQAVQTVVANLGLVDWNSVTVPVSIRKLPRAEEEIDTLPLICVVPNDKPVKVLPVVFGQNIWADYPVEIVAIAPGNSDFTSTHLDTYTQWQQNLRQAFQGPTLSGVSQVWDTTMNPELVINRKLLQSQYDYGGIGVSFRVWESRTGS